LPSQEELSSMSTMSTTELLRLWEGAREDYAQCHGGDSGYPFQEDLPKLKKDATDRLAAIEEEINLRIPPRTESD